MDLITVTEKTGLEFNIRVRGHEVTSDMSAKDGGRDRGPFAGGAAGRLAGRVYRDDGAELLRRHGYTTATSASASRWSWRTSPSGSEASSSTWNCRTGFPRTRWK